MIRFFKRVRHLHRFFVEMSPEFVGKMVDVDMFGYPVYKLSFKNYLYYPIAYIKFMYSCILDK